MYKYAAIETLIPDQGSMTYRKYVSGLHNLKMAQVNAPIKTTGQRENRINIRINILVSIIVSLYKKLNF